MNLSYHVDYRPKTWDEVIGQDAVVRSLKGVVKAGTSHAFIFTGPSGTGKTTLARILANEFAKGKATVANIQEVAAADKTGIDDVRQLVAKAIHRALGESPVKTLILDEAHRLSGAAWDALLKPIEEPPAHVYWMFCTTNAGKIPKTILTRCQRFELKPVSEELIYELLCSVSEAEGIEVPEEVIEAVAEACGGSPRQALVFLASVSGCRSATQAKAVMQTAAQSKEAIDLGRWLLSGKAQTWSEAIKYVNALNGVDAESVRITIVNYLAVVLLNTKSDGKAKQLLGLLELFSQPYLASDKMAPLLRSIGLALNLDQ